MDLTPDNHGLAFVVGASDSGCARQVRKMGVTWSARAHFRYFRRCDDCGGVGYGDRPIRWFGEGKWRTKKVDGQKRGKRVNKEVVDPGRGSSGVSA